jgi:predicted metal-binding membrane protein
MKMDLNSTNHGSDIMTTTRIEERAHSTEVWFYASSALVFCICLIATLYFVRSMSGGMQMPGGWQMSMIWMRMPGQNWLSASAMFLAMWLAMMVAMMLPSAFPMLSHFKRSMSGSAWLVACGYFLVWAAAGGFVYVLGTGLAYAAMRWMSFGSAMPLLAGVSLIMAGAFQLTHWKRIALNHCRDSLVCRLPEREIARSAAFKHGLNQGLFCGICCSGLMIALLVAGMMNPLAMLAIAVVIAMEKLLPNPVLIVRLTGAIAALTGIALIVKAL